MARRHSRFLTAIFHTSWVSKDFSGTPVTCSPYHVVSSELPPDFVVSRCRVMFELSGVVPFFCAVNFGYVGFPPFAGFELREEFFGVKILPAELSISILWEML